MTNAEIDRYGKLVLAEGPSEWEIDLTKPEGRMEAHLRWEAGLVGYHPVYKTTADFMRDLRGVLSAHKSALYERDHYFEAWKQATKEPSSGDRIYNLTIGKSSNQVIKVGAIWDAYFERNKQLELDCG